MARRKSTEDVQVAAPVLPERLRECFVEDWIDVDHEPASYRSASDEGEVIWYLQFQAWSAWRHERSAWAEDHGIGRQAFSRLYPVSRPKFRDGARELIDAIGPRLLARAAL